MYINKYGIDVSKDVNTFILPMVRALTVDYENGQPFFYAVIDPGRKKDVNVDILKVGTRVGAGYMFERMDTKLNPTNYLNTTVYQSEPFVLHWFYNIRKIKKKKIKIIRGEAFAWEEHRERHGFGFFEHLPETC